ncbi:MAG: tetratricopeptide repeat protein [Oligoflexales bacterium]|nr:tetratricopeptide repeat protein [Oligoflexales bacterium]
MITNTDKLKVMVLSADEENIKAVKLSLDQLGFKSIEIVNSGLDALEKIKAKPFDFIICDQNSRFISGWLFIKEIKISDQVPNIPVLLLGKMKTPDTEDALKRYGVLKYLQCPVSSSTLNFLISSTITLAKTSGTIEYKFSKAKDSLMKNQLDEAIEAFSELRSLTNGNARSSIGLAQSYQKQGDEEKAEKILMEVADSSDDTPARLLMQIQISLKQSRPKDANKYCEKLLTDVPNEFYFTKVAWLYIDSNYPQDAEGFCHKAIAANYEIPVFYLCLAKSNYLKGNMLKALEIIGTSSSHFGMDAELFNLKGVCLKKIGKFKEAIECYEEALRLAPNDAKIYFNMAMCNIGIKDYESATRQLTTCVKISPNFPKAKEKLDELINRDTLGTKPAA